MGKEIHVSTFMNKIIRS